MYKYLHHLLNYRLSTVSDLQKRFFHEQHPNSLKKTCVFSGIACHTWMNIIFPRNVPEELFWDLVEVINSLTEVPLTAGITVISHNSRHVSWSLRLQRKKKKSAPTVMQTKKIGNYTIRFKRNVHALLHSITRELIILRPSWRRRVEWDATEKGDYLKYNRSQSWGSRAVPL